MCINLMRIVTTMNGLFFIHICVTMDPCQYN